MSATSSSSSGKEDRLGHLAPLRTRILSVVDGPGVYRWFDADKNLLYIGKAKNLKHRLLSYVQKGRPHTPWTAMMLRQARDFDVTVTNSELEALMLETNLIKEHKPKYNIMMKDDKNYVYVRISMQDTYPRIDVVRKMEEDGALYFGPKPSADEVRRTLVFLRRLFPFRTCKMDIELRQMSDSRCQTPDENQQPATSNPQHMRESVSLSQGRVMIDVICKNRDRPTPCLDHHIKQCAAPCIGTVTPEQYRRESIDGVISFFKGKHAELIEHIVARMKEAVAEKKFERAAEFRDQLRRIESLQEKQLVSDTSREDADIIGVAVRTGRAWVVLFKQRDGKLVSEETYPLTGQVETAAEALDEFLPQYYAGTDEFPDLVILSDEPNERSVLEEWLCVQRGKKIRLHVPQRGKKSALLLLALKNANWKAEQSATKWEVQAGSIERALATLAEELSLPSPPVRIEGYDISHLGGSFTVGSMVVVQNGKPKREHYRSFSVRSLKDGMIDDYQSLREVLSRRLRYLAHDPKAEEERYKEEGITFGKARKAEQKSIEEILGKFPEQFPYRDIRSKDFLVARLNDERIIGFVRLVSRVKGITEIASLWIDEEFREKKLGQVLLRRILKTVKKGKVYVRCVTTLERSYADAGFRHVEHAPKEFLEDAAHDPACIVMVYIVSEHKVDPSFLSTPDLLVIDGGKGQLSIALEVLKEKNLQIPVIGLAKQEESILLPDADEPLPLSKDHPAQFLLQRLRDEAHRFANEIRKKQGKNATFHSGLDDIAGVGDKTRAALLKKFGSLSGVRDATDEELLRIVSRTQLATMRASLK